MEDGEMFVWLLGMFGLLSVFSFLTGICLRKISKRMEWMVDEIYEGHSSVNVKLSQILEKVSDINLRVTVVETRLEERSQSINIQPVPQLTQQKRKYVRKK